MGNVPSGNFQVTFLVLMRVALAGNKFGSEQLRRPSTMNSARHYLKPDLIRCLQDYLGSSYAAYLG